MRSVAVLLLLPLSALAAHAVVAVVPPDSAAKAGPSVELETKLGHAQDLTIISRGAQLEILRGLALKKGAKVDDKLALKIAKLAGADAVVIGVPGSFRLCRQPEARCVPLSATDATQAAATVFPTLGASPPAARAEPWPDETKSPAALTAYASCRAAVSLALEQKAIKGRDAVIKGIDGDCKKAVSADAAWLTAKAGLAAAHALQGDADAEAELRQALENLPTDPLPALALVQLLDATDRPQDALDALAAAADRAPQLLDLHRARGERLFRADQFKEAQTDFEKALALAPRSPYLHWRISYTLHMDGNDAEAVKHAEQASQLSGGDHPFFQEEYGSRLIDVGRHGDAQKVLEPLRKKDPKWGRVALRLGYAQYLQGNAKAALPLFLEAAKSKPRDAREKDDARLAGFDAARAYAKLGNKEGALKQLEALNAAGALDVASLKDPDLAVLVDDPRFDALTP